MIPIEDKLEWALARMDEGARPVDLPVGGSQDSEGELRELLELAARLRQLPITPLPAPEERQADREVFLASLEATLPHAPSVGVAAVVTAWVARARQGAADSLDAIRQRMEARAMFMLAARVVLMIAIGAGTLSAVTASASGSLPDSPLYPLKMAQEQVRLGLTQDPVMTARLSWQMAWERAEELRLMFQTGRVPDGAVLNRFEQQLGLALGSTARLSDGAMKRQLEQAAKQARRQEMLMSELRPGPGSDAGEHIAAAQQLVLQARLRLELGVADGQAFRWQHAHGWPLPEPGEGSGYGEGPGPGPVGEPQRYQHREMEPTSDCLGNDACGPPPEQEQTRERVQERTCQDDEPGAPGCGEPAGAEHQYGQDQDPTGAAGPGPGDCNGCEPEGDENQHREEGDSSGGDNQGGNSDSGGQPGNGGESGGDGGSGASGP
jgi:uncharacterized membrane protein YgcG